MINLFRKKFNVPMGGCIPSLPDNRDILSSNILPEVKRIPESCPPPFDLTILNQLQEPSCVGFTAAIMKQEKEMEEKIFKVFDGSWIFRECKKIDGIPNASGTYLRTGMSILKNIGAMPINETDASKYKIGSYAKVDDLTFEGLKKVVYLSKGMMAGFTGSNQGWQTAYIRPPKAGETTWGHAVAIIGYTKDYLIGANSWGLGWGDNGLFYIPKTYLPFEAWQILVDSPTDSPIVQSADGYIALNSNWTTSDKTLVRINLRKEPIIGNNIIKVLPVDTKISIIEWAGYSNNFHWLSIKL